MEAGKKSVGSLRQKDAGSGISGMSSTSLSPATSDTDVTEPQEVSHIIAIRTGLHFSADTPYATWKALGAKLGARKSSACWWLGDWLLFGERAYGRYDDAIGATGLDYQTLRNYATVSRRFPLSRRRDNLSFQHHAAVAALPDETQERWLNLAASNSWSLHTLRGEIRKARVLEPAGPGLVVRVQVEAAREERWRTAASENGVSLQQWIVASLDAAAQSNPRPARPAAITTGG